MYTAFAQSTSHVNGQASALPRVMQVQSEAGSVRRAVLNAAEELRTMQEPNTTPFAASIVIIDNTGKVLHESDPNAWRGK